VTTAFIEAAEPVWARAEAFAPAPQGWGWMDLKRREHPCASLDALAAAVRDDRHSAILLVWTPDDARMRLPEEISGLSAAMGEIRERWTREDLLAAVNRLRWFGLLLASFAVYAFYGGMQTAAKAAAEFGPALVLHDRLRFAGKAMLGSMPLGLALLMFVVFGFIPWYQARKRRAELATWNAAATAGHAQVGSPTLSRNEIPVGFDDSRRLGSRVAGG